ncbi:hypothetical protein SLAVM298S_06178 [Streptomyces lavendulae subsp. lavendulae]
MAASAPGVTEAARAASAAPVASGGPWGASIRRTSRRAGSLGRSASTRAAWAASSHRATTAPESESTQASSSSPAVGYTGTSTAPAARIPKWA